MDLPTLAAHFSLGLILGSLSGIQSLRNWRVDLLRIVPVKGGSG